MHGSNIKKWLLYGLPLLVLATGHAQGPTPAPTPSPEEIDAMTFRWLRDYAGYIITDEERDSFLATDSAEARLAFIDRFWKRRDPTPGTARNEAREEHMRRYSYANQRFRAGKPGWKTDRGRTYILLGEPQTRSRNPMGRASHERASEVWSYNGVKSRTLRASFDINFVDFNDTGDYQIVTDLNLAAPINPYVGYVGHPLDVISRAVNSDALIDPLGFRSRADTFDFQDLVQSNFDLMRDLQAVQEAGQTADLSKNEVETRIQFASFPVDVSEAYYRSGGQQTRIQISFSLDFSPLASKLYKGQHYFHVEVLSRLLKGGAAGSNVDQSREDISFQVPERQLSAASKQPVVYQVEQFAPPGAYTLELILRDGVSQRVSVTRKELVVPALGVEGLDLSTPLLCETIRKTEEAGSGPFRHGNLLLLPRVSGIFSPNETMQVYLQIYGVDRDEQGAYQLQLDYRIWSAAGGLVLRSPSQSSEGRGQGAVALYTALPLRQLEPGRYEVEALVLDKRSNRRAQRRVPFEIRIAKPS